MKSNLNTKISSIQERLDTNLSNYNLDSNNDPKNFSINNNNPSKNDFQLVQDKLKQKYDSEYS